jgi:hypothetical protein
VVGRRKRTLCSSAGRRKVELCDAMDTGRPVGVLVAGFWQAGIPEQTVGRYERP